MRGKDMVYENFYFLLFLLIINVIVYSFLGLAGIAWPNFHHSGIVSIYFTDIFIKFCTLR